MSQDIPLLRLSLSGRHLLEASAGTGKTWTIGGLFVRLLLEREVAVDQILVVTFTKAATAELVGRVRARLREVHDMLDDGKPGRDPLLQHLHQQWGASDQQRNRALFLLRRALAGFDTAAIYTIHGFCQRLLEEHPFECGMRGDEELGPEQGSLRAMALDDYWRQHCSHGDADVQALLDLLQLSAGDFHARELRGALASAEAQVLPDGPGLAALAAHWAELQIQLRTEWSQRTSQISELMMHEHLQPAVRKKGADKIEALAQWLEHDGPMPDKLQECGQDFLLKKCRKVKGEQLTLPEDVFLSLVDQALAWKEQAAALIQRDALLWARERLQGLKTDAGVLDYEDLLNRVNGALAGDRGHALGELIRERFPAALIDEFQDTDPVQYQIFDRIYGGDQSLLAFVGDPKQAIYSFRGGDIFTYMAARESVQDQLSLSANFRSTESMIRAVNTLFDHEQNPRPFFHPGIDYQPVEPGKSDLPALVDPQGDAAMHVWWLGEDGALKKGDAEAACVQATALEVARLLCEARIGERGVQPSDICVLVLKHEQGRAVQQALQVLNIPSVRSGQDNVFHTDQARELAIVLQAAAQPSRGDWMRAALGTSLCGWTASDIVRLEHHESLDARIVELFYSLHQCWQQHGFLAMFEQFLVKFGVPERVLRAEEGERAMTNLLQLAELAHAASSGEEMTAERLLDWFGRQLTEPDEGDSEANLLRLESDADRVHIMTVHKSKGLEFNICLAPFLCLKGNPRSVKTAVYHAEESGHGTVRDFAPDEQAKSLFLDELLAEGLRLAYVAVTRSVHRCYLAWGACNEVWQSPLAWLFHGGEHQDDVLPRKTCADALQADIKEAGSANLREKLEQWVQRAAGAVACVDLPDGPGMRRRDDNDTDEALQEQVFAGRLDRGWVLTSYSGIVARRDPERPDYDGHVLAPLNVEQEQPETAFLKLPGGTSFGTAIHGIFEFLRPESPEQDRAALVREQLLQKLQLNDADLQEWVPAVLQMLDSVLQTPLAEAGIRLADLQAGKYLNEMGFGCALNGFEGGALSRLLHAHTEYCDAGFDEAAKALPAFRLQTFLNGEIDLCFEAGGRYFIADWKTNLLGRRLTAYNHDALTDCVRSHHYYLQYLLYALALHRHLRNTLPAYDYEQHFGGVYYLFVRGMDGSGQGVYFDRPPLTLIAALDAEAAA